MKNFYLFYLWIGALAMFSCNNEDEVLTPEDNIELKASVETVVTSEEAAEDVMESADYETDLFSFAESEYDQPTTTKSGNMYRYHEMFRMWNRYKDGVCPDVSIEFGEERYPITIIIDYGDSLVLNNGRILSGMIQIVLSAPPCQDGATRTITYNNFSCDSVLINGTKTITFTGEVGVSKKFEHVSELTFTFPDGTELFRYEERTREWVAGLDTKFDISDDRIEITGSTTCVDSEGNEYTKQITEALVKIGTCRMIVSGVVLFSQNGEEFATLDYGDGECDNLATLTTSEGTQEIEIGKHNRHRNRNGNGN